MHIRRTLRGYKALDLSTQRHRYFRKLSDARAFSNLGFGNYAMKIVLRDAPASVRHLASSMLEDAARGEKLARCAWWDFLEEHGNSREFGGVRRLAKRESYLGLGSRKKNG